MKKSKKVLIMLVGKTHSGKTTFAKRIEKKIKDLVVLEADPIAVFMKENFPVLRENDDLHHNARFNKVSLKYRTFLSFVEFALSLNRPVILSNSNMWAKGRKLVLNLSRKYNYKVIGVYFNFPEDVLLKRVKNANKSLNVLRTSKNFQELVINQRTRMEPPKSAEFDIFYTLENGLGVEELEKKLIKNLKTNETNLSL